MHTFNIQWKDKPSHHDTHLVKLIWFSGNKICYLIEGDRKHLESPLKTVKAIWADPQFRQEKAPEVLFYANDDSPDALEAAAHNAKLVKDDWCKCGANDDPCAMNQAYFRDRKHGHGWMCGRCRGIVQTG